jgi:hypothetical protein
MKVLTPAALTPHSGSLCLLCLAFRTSNPQPREGLQRRFRSRPNALDGSFDPGFAMNEQARRTIPPKRVRHPAGCSFASSCSLPRIAATQLPSATCDTTSIGRTFTLLTRQHHRRTHSRERGNPGGHVARGVSTFRPRRRSPTCAAASWPLDTRFRGYDKSNLAKSTC